MIHRINNNGIILYNVLWCNRSLLYEIYRGCAPKTLYPGAIVLEYGKRNTLNLTL